jgi:Dna[CI] antecedent, DciA
LSSGADQESSLIEGDGVNDPSTAGDTEGVSRWRRKNPYRPLPDARSGPTSLAFAVDLFRKEHGLRDPTQTEERVLRAWREVAGPELAKTAPAIRFRAGELVVQVESAALYHELVGYRHQDLSRRLAQALPLNLFKRLTVKHAT